MSAKTGPHTLAGKHISSQNAAKHYMTSTQLLVSGESARDLELLVIQWHDAFPTDLPLFTKDVSKAAESDWLLRRAQRGYDAKMKILYAQPQELWTADTHAEFQLFHRYLTAARRTLDRNRATILQVRRELRAHERQQAAPAEELPAASSNPVPPARKFPPAPILQHIEVSVLEGLTKTAINPSNSTILADLARLPSMPGVRRELIFLNNHVPPDFEWIGAHFPGQCHVFTFTPAQFRLVAGFENDGPPRPVDHLFPRKSLCPPKESN